MPHTSTKQECILWDDTQPRSKTNISKAEEYLKLLKAFFKRARPCAKCLQWKWVSFWNQCPDRVRNQPCRYLWMQLMQIHHEAWLQWVSGNCICCGHNSTTVSLFTWFLQFTVYYIFNIWLLYGFHSCLNYLVGFVSDVVLVPRNKHNIEHSYCTVQPTWECAGAPWLCWCHQSRHLLCSQAPFETRLETSSICQSQFYQQCQPRRKYTETLCIC